MCIIPNITTIAHPLNLLYPIEVCDDASEPNENKGQQQRVPSKEESTNQRKTRTADKHAKEKMKQISPSN